MLEHITKLCQDLLESYPGAESVRDYLKDRVPEASQKEFQMGYFPGNHNLSLLKNFIKEEDLLKSGLFYYRITDGDKTLCSTLENHNLIMPYKDVYGKIIALVGRTVLPEKEWKELGIPKYKNTQFKKGNHLFGLWRAKESIIKKNCVFVVEGQFDCISAISNGIENCVCLGSGSMTFIQFALLSRYTDNIIMLLDNDPAGIAGMNAAMSSFGSKANIRKACVPEGYKDIDQFLQSEGNSAKEFLSFLM